MQTLCIDKRLIGSEKHILIKGGVEWKLVSDVPHACWHLSDEQKDYVNNCVDTLFRLEDVQFDLSPPQRYVSLAKQYFGDVPWQKIAPLRAWKSHVSDLATKAIDALGNIDPTYYERTWVHQRPLFKAFERVCVDNEKISEYITSGRVKNTAQLESFRPNEDGLTNPIEYDRFATLTGRLGIKNGPSILTLQRDCRDIIISRYPGRVAYMDFSSLEAHVLMAQAGHYGTQEDLYEFLNRTEFDGKFTRQQSKEIVICGMYGQQPATLAHKFNCSSQEMSIYVDHVKKQFKIDELIEKLTQQYAFNERIRNARSRLLKPQSSAHHVLINTYTQSTGNDVALTGFASFVPDLKALGCRILYVLHDALFIEVPEKTWRDLSMTVWKYNDKILKHKFPVSIREVSRSM